MRFLEILAEAVNAIHEWPNEWVWVADEPARLSIGYQVNDLRWTISIRQLREELPEIEWKRDQLNVMAGKIKLPLQPYPAQVREREILARTALLRASVHFRDIPCRQETAKWLTFLGRMRADPSGRLLNGDPEQEPVPKARPRAYLVRT